MGAADGNHQKDIFGQLRYRLIFLSRIQNPESVRLAAVADCPIIPRKDSLCHATRPLAHLRWPKMKKLAVNAPESARYGHTPGRRTRTNDLLCFRYRRITGTTRYLQTSRPLQSSPLAPVSLLPHQLQQRDSQNRSFRQQGLEFLVHLRHDLEKVAHDTVIGLSKDRRFLVLVNRDDNL